MMTRRLNIFLILCFFSVQLFSLLHSAEFAFKSHQHNEQLCAHYLHLKQSSAPSSAQPLMALTAVYLKAEDISLPAMPFSQRVHRHSIATRAPPHIA